MSADHSSDGPPPKAGSSGEPLASLYRGAAAGDIEATAGLMQAWLLPLRAFVRAHLPPDLRARESDSDIVQSVCRELLGQREHFTFQGESQFRGWLFTAALNKVRTKVRFHRRRKRDARRELPPADSGGGAVRELPADTAGPLAEALANERLDVLDGALQQLSAGDRQVIVLARLGGLPIADVATRLGKNVEAARKQLGRALLRLSVLLRASETGGA